MAKRKFRDIAGVPFDEENNNGSSPFEDSLLHFDAAIFGDIAKADAAVERVKYVNIFEIVPDPMQPRRAVPHSVRRQWNGNPTTITELFQIWKEVVDQERLKAGMERFPLDRFLQGHSTPDDRRELPGPMESSFLAIVDLAISIRRDGLTNPISIVNKGRDTTGTLLYRLETGERRWLAYHILYDYFDGRMASIPDERDQWGKIQVRLMESLSVWRQATENSARSDLNAIAKTRQLALLIMELLSNDTSDRVEFKPFDAFKSEREFYAQVKGQRMPYGKNDILLSAMRLNSRQAVDRYRSLLDLPDDIWYMADETDCPEGFLRRIVDMPYAVQMSKFAAWAKREGRVIPALEMEAPTEPSKPPAPRLTLPADPALRNGNRLIHEQEELYAVRQLKLLTSLREGLTTAKPDTKKMVKLMIDDLRGLLDDIEGKL